MKKIARKFSTFDEAAKAEDEFYSSLNPEQRVSILLELINQYWNSVE